MRECLRHLHASSRCMATLTTLLILMLATVAGATPTASFTYPASGAGNVSVGTNIQATFSEAMDPSVINNQTFTLNRQVKVKAIATGWYHNVVLRTDGTVAVWGNDLTDIYSSNYGQLDVPPGLTGVTAVAAGGSHAVALKNDGTVVAWGSNAYGQATPPAGLSGVIAVSAGWYHTVALKGDGTVVAWGSNNAGQANVPAGLTGVKAIAAGGYFTLALKNDGTVVGWGDSSWYQNRVPTGLSGVAAIAAGWNHALALKCDGTVVAWGVNNYGQSTVPAGLSEVIAIAAATEGYHSAAVKRDGTVVTWGRNTNGQTTVPAGLTGVWAIAAGGNFTTALKSDGTLVGWGGNSYAQATVPVESSEVMAIAEGGTHTLALKRDGTVAAWGSNDWGQSTVPAGLSGVTAIAGGGSASLALKGDGTVVAWGRNLEGQGTVPAGLSGVTAIAAGYSHSVALKNDGTVVAWGGNTYGQTAVPPGLSGVTAIAAVGYYTLALKQDGTVVAWGDKNAWGYDYIYNGQLAVPEGIAGVVAIAAGLNHAVALRNDGTVVAWGYNTYGQTSVPAGLTGVTEIGAGVIFSVALKNDGTVVKWGGEPNQISLSIPSPSGLSGVSQISVSWDTIAALKATGGMVIWGSRAYGQAPAPYPYRFGNIYESQIGGSITYDPVMHTATFTPFSPLEPGVYTADVATIRSAIGEKLATPAKWTFTTENYDPTATFQYAEPVYATCAGPATYEIRGTVAGGSGTISCVSPVNSGTASTCTVTPAAGYQLLNLTDNGNNVTAQVNNSAYTIINVSADHAVAAIFAHLPVNGLCGSSDGQSLPSAPSTNLCSAGTATAVTGSGPWTWSCTGLYGGSSANCSATLITYSLVVTVTGSGTVHSAPGADVNCSGGCSQSFNVGSSLSLSAASNFGSYFTGWSGACAGTGNCEVLMSQNQPVGATFTADTTPPVMSGMIDRVIEATSTAGAVASFTVTATDNFDPAPSATCSPSSGSSFALGTSIVTCTARDRSNNSVTGTFTIKVQDTTPPALTVPQDITVLLNTPLTAPMVQAFLNGATATDIVDRSVTIVSTSPDLNSVGTKLVTFTAVDDFGNKTTRIARINVVYGCGDEFEPPVSLLKPFKQGSTIPVKFRLCDASGADVFTAAARLYLQMYSGNGTVGAPVEATSTSGADTGNSFRVSGSHYMYNLFTKSLPSGTYQLQAVLDDGTTRTVPLALKQ
jgi:alpha-tubulin suppressor-like RCC1 family protein